MFLKFLKNFKVPIPFQNVFQIIFITFKFFQKCFKIFNRNAFQNYSENFILTFAKTVKKFLGNVLNVLLKIFLKYL